MVAVDGAQWEAWSGGLGEDRQWCGEADRRGSVSGGGGAIYRPDWWRLVMVWLGWSSWRAASARPPLGCMASGVALQVVPAWELSVVRC